jgi:hypothetical protein
MTHRDVDGDAGSTHTSHMSGVTRKAVPPGDEKGAAPPAPPAAASAAAAVAAAASAPHQSAPSGTVPVATTASPRMAMPMARTPAPASLAAAHADRTESSRCRLARAIFWEWGGAESAKGGCTPDLLELVRAGPGLGRAVERTQR